MPLVEKKPQCHHTRWSSIRARVPHVILFTAIKLVFGEERGKELSQETLYSKLFNC